MNKLICLLLFITCFSGCIKSTDQPSNKDTWVLKASNKTQYPIQLIFKNNTTHEYPDTFNIDTFENIELFRGAYGLLVDEISRKYYDTCKLVFSDKYILKFNRKDTLQHNILTIDNFKATGEYQNGMKVLLYTITIDDLKLADTL
jgi:hypothetical protein